MWVDAIFLAYALFRCANTGIDAWACDDEDHLWGHEETFDKRAFTTQVHFRSPAAKGMDLIPYTSLSDQQRIELARFCEIRYGSLDIPACYASMENTMRR
jgi:hypothetical protein